MPQPTTRDTEKRTASPSPEPVMSFGCKMNPHSWRHKSEKPVNLAINSSFGSLSPSTVSRTRPGREVPKKQKSWNLCVATGWVRDLRHPRRPVNLVLGPKRDQQTRVFRVGGTL
ncbi:hypothetical protein PT974_10722 [Cladobotryum mycophilum]|uniref:Uncharacterized protein n=1 Tax=Cladobotryum mycophilum TaxID=491253 RepID=A0ABR0SBN9_9HYPO